jgi:hypothetical protein
MPKLYADGLTSDRTVSSGARVTPAVREATVTTTLQTLESTKLASKKVDEALRWLSDKAKAVTPVGSAVLQTTVETAGNAAGHATSDVQAAIVQLSSGIIARFARDVTAGTITRRF